jgi:aquaporin Z
MKNRPLIAEAVGTALLVFFGAGTATLSFGFKVAGASVSAGVVATGLAFGLVLLVLVYGFGPVSGCHVNPAVTIGFLVGRRITVTDAIGYWIAQFVGAIVGAAVLYGTFQLTSDYKKSFGLGANGFGASSMIGANAGAAFITEVILTFVFVFVILTVTRRVSNAAVAGLVIGLSLTMVHLIGIPIDGTSVNPARSLGPALFVGGTALSQLWLFIIAPLVGGALSAVLYQFLYPKGEEEASVAPAREEQAQPTTEPQS